MYVNDILYLAVDTKPDMTSLNQTYRLTEGIVTTPNIYLDTNIKKLELEDGGILWPIM